MPICYPTARPSQSLHHVCRHGHDRVASFVTLFAATWPTARLGRGTTSVSLSEWRERRESAHKVELLGTSALRGKKTRTNASNKCARINSSDWVVGTRSWTNVHSISFLFYAFIWRPCRYPEYYLFVIWGDYKKGNKCLDYTRRLHVLTGLET